MILISILSKYMFCVIIYELELNVETYVRASSVRVSFKERGREEETREKSKEESRGGNKRGRNKIEE